MQGFVFRVQDLGLRFPVLGLRVKFSGFRASGFVFRV